MREKKEASLTIPSPTATPNSRERKWTLFNERGVGAPAPASKPPKAYLPPTWLRWSPRGWLASIQPPLPHAGSRRAKTCPFAFWSATESWVRKRVSLLKTATSEKERKTVSVDGETEPSVDIHVISPTAWILNLPTMVTEATSGCNRIPDALRKNFRSGQFCLARRARLVFRPRSDRRGELPAFRFSGSSTTVDREDGDSFVRRITGAPCPVLNCWDSCASMPAQVPALVIQSAGWDLLSGSRQT
ncbi:uncharacterized protein B0T15DRAFT_236882 [Chaetomium strumarium]|uniref:Uncharacterized protein n=1 Tax=Chaetomium strumarium TaxID=1170767 RepID=A0AAJ0M0C7_9PEZI|nr:hypothetical protein B0T15DRAFT_236882 [Chaetomium strumarium]